MRRLLPDISNFDDLCPARVIETQTMKSQNDLIQDRTRRTCDVKSRLEIWSVADTSGEKERNVSSEDCNLHNFQEIDKSTRSMQIANASRKIDLIPSRILLEVP